MQFLGRSVASALLAMRTLFCSQDQGQFRALTKIPMSSFSVPLSISRKLSIPGETEMRGRFEKARRSQIHEMQNMALLPIKMSYKFSQRNY